MANQYNASLGGFGTVLIKAGTPAADTSFEYLVINTTPTTFTSIASDTDNVMTELEILNTDAFASGTIIRALNNKSITDVVVATGSCLGIRNTATQS